MNNKKSSPQRNKVPNQVAQSRKINRSGLGCSLLLAVFLLALGAGVAVGGVVTIFAPLLAALGALAALIAHMKVQIIRSEDGNQS